jgi:hypothetical protein
LHGNAAEHETDKQAAPEKTSSVPATHSAMARGNVADGGGLGTTQGLLPTENGRYKLAVKLSKISRGRPRVLCDGR